MLAYNNDCSRTVGLQVKTLSQRAAVPLGADLAKAMGDFWVIVNNVLKEPSVYVLTPTEVRERAHRNEKDGQVSFWLELRDYGTNEFKDAWKRLGEPASK